MWCRSRLVWLVFEDFIPTCACLRLANFFVTCFIIWSAAQPIRAPQPFFHLCLHIISNVVYLQREYILIRLPPPPPPHTHTDSLGTTLGLLYNKLHSNVTVDSRRIGNALRLECFVPCRHTVIKRDGHATAICTSSVGANKTKLALHERRRLCCKQASLPGRTVKAWEWLCSSAMSQ